MMSRLVGYGSSEEDDDPLDQISEDKTVETRAKTANLRSYSTAKVTNDITNDVQTESVIQKVISHAQPRRDEQAMRPVEGPAAQNFELEPAVSHYGNQTLIQNLTLPIFPNLDIPESPPGSPPSDLDNKFKQFDRLKAQGIHFNEKLANSSALKNPSLTIKLIRAAGMDEQEQYASALPKNMWDPTSFPLWAFKDELAKAQKQREDQWMQNRNRVDFVPATGFKNSSGTGAQGSKSSKESAAERVLSSLDRK